MKRAIALSVVLLLLLNIPLVTADAGSRVLVTMNTFGNGEEEIKMDINRTLENTSAFIELPRNAVVKNAFMEVEAREQIETKGLEIYGGMAFKENGYGDPDLEFRDETIGPKINTSSIAIDTDDGFNRSQRTNIMINDGVFLERYETMWYQDGFKGGPGQVEQTDISKFLGSENIDWQNLEGPARLVPTYDVFTHNPIGSPPNPRAGMAYALNTPANKMHVYGGYERSMFQPYDDHHYLDLVSMSWTEDCIGCMPGFMSNGTGVWNASTNAFVVSGGIDDSVSMVLVSTWEHQNGPVWDMYIMPDFRTDHSEVYATSFQKTILFGGRDMSLNPTDTIYERDNNGWRTASYTGQVPGERYGHSAVWDDEGKRMIVYGGFDGSIALAEVYILDLNTNQWVKKNNAPTGRGNHVAVWDDKAKGMIVHGGNDAGGNTIYSDAYIYWPTNDTWTPLKPLNNLVLGRMDHAAVFSKGQGSMYIWGGANDRFGTVTDSMLYQVKRSYKTSGLIDSSVMGGSIEQLPQRAIVNGIGVNEEPNLLVDMFIRTGGDTNPSSPSWTPWKGPFHVLNKNAVFPPSEIKANKYFQYRLQLTSEVPGETPVVDNVTIITGCFYNTGELVTDPIEVHPIPLEFETLKVDANLPPDTSYILTVRTSSDGTNWVEHVFTDNESIKEFKPQAFLSFKMKIATQNTAYSPCIKAIVLIYHYYEDSATYILDSIREENNIVRIHPYWIPIFDANGATTSKVEAAISFDGGDSWLELMNDEDVMIKPIGEGSINTFWIKFTFLSKGNFDAGIYLLDLEYDTGILPRSVEISTEGSDVKQTIFADDSFQGSIEKVGITEMLGSALRNHKDKLDTPEVTIRFKIRAKNECTILLGALNVEYDLSNYLPFFESDPILVAFAGNDYSYEVKVKDKDMGDILTLTLENAPTGMILNEEGAKHILFWTPLISQLGKHAVRLLVSDGKDSTAQAFTLEVTDENKNNLPVFNSVPAKMQKPSNTVPVVTGDEFKYVVEVSDQDPGDVVEVSMLEGPEGIAFDPTSLTLKWTPDSSDIGGHKVVLRAFDGKGSTYQVFTINVTEDLNRAPYFVNKPPKELDAVRGKDFKYVVEATDDDGDTIVYSIVNAPAWLTIDIDGRITGNVPKDSDDQYTFTIEISDSRETDQAEVTLKVKDDSKPVVGGMSFDDLLGLLIIVIIIAVVLSVVGIAVSRRRKKARAGEEDLGPGPDASVDEGPVTPPPRPPAPPKRHVTAEGKVHGVAKAHHTRTGSGAAVGAAAAGTAAGAAAGGAAVKPEDKPLIEDVYLIYNDGRLIAHQTKSLRPDMDEYVLSGMLKAIQEFVKDSLSCEGFLGGLDYGEKRIMIEIGAHATLALVITGKESAALREEMKRTLEKIQGLYAGIIEDWDGEVKHFRDVKKYLQPLILMGRTIEEDAEMGDVRVMSALEFYQGYVRLKVGIKNQYPYMIHDVSLKLIHDKKALQLSHVEPEYPLEGAEVEIGNISPKEKKTVAFYLDPLICMESNIDASVMYKNFKGEIKTEMMKRRPVDIVCPIFYTEQNVNVAMLKRLINELKYSDRKVYSLPKSMGPEKAIGLAKETVQSHDVKFVRQFEEQEPYIGEAWFYGKTKQTLEDLVIRATVRAETNTLEIFVASSNLATIPGLLADLAHGLKRRYTSTRKTKEDLAPLTDAKVKDQIEKSRLLIEKFATSEADAESEEIDI